MSNPVNYDVIGIGNAIVDVIAPSSDTFLDQMGITKGIMQLLERDRPELPYASMDRPAQAPGGLHPHTVSRLR